MTTLAIVDTETTGLDPDRHEIWEVALVLRRTLTDKHDAESEYRWLLPVDLGKADPVALTIGRFYDRVDPTWANNPMVMKDVTPLGHFAHEFARLTHGAHLIGAVPSFDEERLRKLLRANGACPGWHYQPIDVETLAVGFLRGSGSRSVDDDVLEALALPWDSDKLSMAVGVDPGDFDRHTALGDARWAKAIFDRIMIGVES